MAAAESQGWAYAMGVLHGAHTTTTPDPPEPGTGDSQSTHLVSVLCVAIEDEVQHAALVGRDGAVYNGGAVNVHVHQQTGHRLKTKRMALRKIRNLKNQNRMLVDLPLTKQMPTLVVISLRKII